MKLCLKLAVILGAIAGALLLAGAAFASTSSHPGPAVTDACYHNGETTTKHGETFKCVVPKDASCGVWTWVYNPETPKSGKTAWPHPTCPCASGSASASPTPSHTPTATPTPSHTPTPTASPSGTAVTVTGSLPVTGSPVVAIVSLAGALLALGALALLAARSRNRRTV